MRERNTEITKTNKKKDDRYKPEYVNNQVPGD